MSRWVEGRIRNKIHWTEELFSIQVEAEVDDFVAGQFTRLALDFDDHRVARPYSYVNAPHETLLEFCMVTVPEGPLTNSLVAMEPGSSVLVARKANGFFTLREVPEGRDLWLLATGTAIGPYISILRTPEPWERFERVVLAHAVRQRAELTYPEDIQAFQATHPGQFTYQPYVTREDCGDFALRARIPATIEDGRLEERVGVGIDAEHSQVMICGNPDMVRDTSEVLQARGLTRNKRREPGQITTENYW